MLIKRPDSFKSSISFFISLYKFVYIGKSFSSEIQKCKYFKIVAILPKIVKKSQTTAKQLTKKEPVSIQSSKGRMWTTFNAQ